MGFLSKLLKILAYVPSILIGIEALHGAGNGDQKKKAAMDLVRTALVTAEGITEKDIADNGKFTEGVEKVVDGVVACLNASVWYKKG
jgi:hypothetical protein